MAIDTKPNLSNRKFEQCSGDTMNLSGCTQIYGFFDMESGSTLSICSNAGAGKILTSDAAGVATWQQFSGITGASNGLCKQGQTVVLGGTLTGDTYIDIGNAANDFKICYNGNDNCIGLSATEGRIYIGSSAAEHGYVIVTGNQVGFGSASGTSNATMNLQHTTGNINFGSNQSIKTCHTSTGFYYTSNYCSTGGNNPRWIPDVAWVTGQTAGLGSASGDRIVKEVSQATHGFAVGDYIGWSGGTYNLAIADGNYEGEFVGLVSEVPDASTFCVTQAGYVTGLTGLVQNTTYFLSPSTAGLITSTAPAADGEIYKSVLVADSTTSGWVLPYVGYVITTGTTGVSSANNGLDVNGGIVQLGGDLIQDTAIDLNSNSLCIAGLPAQSTETKVVFVDTDGKLSCGVAAGSPNTINSGTTNSISGITHTHCLDASTFVTGNQGILVDVNNRFYLDNSYITDVTLPSLYTYTGITGNSNLGSLPSGQTLGMVYITNSGSSTATVNLGTTPTGNDITPFQAIDIDPDEDVSVTVNMRLSQTETKNIYINSSDWTDVNLKVQWANITYQNAETTIDPGDLPIATESTLGAIKVGDGLSIDGGGTLCATGGTGTGTITGATNLGTGNGTIFTSVSGEDIQLKSLSAGTDITITCNANYIAISSNSVGTITGGTNGLGTSGADICLGGTLANNTEFDGTGSNYHLCYAGDYSDNFGARSIPDVAYVTGLTSGSTGSGGFLGLVTKDTAEPSDLADNQWVKPEPMATDCFNYTFDNFLDSGGTAISVNLSLCDVYLRYCCTGATGGYWLNESYSRPLSSGYTWIGDSNCKVCEIPVINEWVGSESLIQYTGQKFAYDTQTVFQVDVGCCITIPNKILCENVELCTVGNTSLFSIPAGKTAMISSAKLIMKQNASPDSFTVSLGNNSCTTPSLSYNNMVANCTIDDVSNGEVYDLLTPSVPTGAVACDGSCLGDEVYIRVQSGSTSTLCANVLIEGYVF